MGNVVAMYSSAEVHQRKNQHGGPTSVELRLRSEQKGLSFINPSPNQGIQVATSSGMQCLERQVLHRSSITQEPGCYLAGRN